MKEPEKKFDGQFKTSWGNRDECRVHRAIIEPQFKLLIWSFCKHLTFLRVATDNGNHTVQTLNQAAYFHLHTLQKKQKKNIGPLGQIGRLIVIDRQYWSVILGLSKSGSSSQERELDSV